MSESERLLQHRETLKLSRSGDADYVQEFIAKAHYEDAAYQVPTRSLSLQK